MDKEGLVTVRKSPLSGSEIIRRILTFASYLWKRWSRLHEKIIIDVSLDNEVPVIRTSDKDSKSELDSSALSLRLLVCMEDLDVFLPLVKYGINRKRWQLRCWLVVGNRPQPYQ